MSSADQINQTENPERKTRKIFGKLPPIQEHTSKGCSSLEKGTQKQVLAYTTRRTSLLKSIYITWRNYRKPSVFQSSEHMKSFFMSYGPIERVVYCSEDSAILVFKLIRSAYIASVYATTRLSQYHINVIWLPEYLEATIKKTFAFGGDKYYLYHR